LSSKINGIKVFLLELDAIGLRIINFDLNFA